MNSVIILVTTLIFGLFHFSEGKPCPEENRAHETRCDSYFRCVVLPSKSHVWVPTQCERGLIYEPDLRLCVLPGDDWECTLGETVPVKNDENNIFGVESFILNSNQEEPDANKTSGNTTLFESKVGEKSDEGDYIEVNSATQNAVNKINNENSLNASDKEGINDESVEFSGDGISEELQMQVKDGNLVMDDTTKVDPNLAAHLQRLSQIISGLKEKYQTTPDVAADLRPDQLNAFLAHYNIRSQFEAINPSAFDKRPVPQDGRIEPDILQQIIKKQQMLQNSKFPQNISTVAPSDSNGYLPVPDIIWPTPAYTSTTHLHSVDSDKNYRKPDGYTNSQIVVNKPEGAILFSLPNADKYQPRPKPEADDNPKISEETLKTVLELSKQMLANQNIRQVLPNNGLYHSVMQPMYVPVPMVNSQQGNLYSSNYFPQSGYENDANYQKISSSSYPNRDYKKKQPLQNMQNDGIHFATTAGSANGMIPRPFNSGTPSQENSNDQIQLYQYQNIDRVDSYGNKVGFNYNKPDESSQDQYSSYQNFDNQNQNSIYSTTLFPPLNYDLPPHVTPATLHTPSPNYDNYNTNGMYNMGSQQQPSFYPNGLNIAQEMPKPLLHQPSEQNFGPQRPQYIRPQTFNGANPQIQFPPNQFSYNQINSIPSPPQMRPINPTSVNIRPNSFQSSSNGASFTSSDSENVALAESEESQFNYNQNSFNDEIVSDVLASNVDHSGTDDHNKLVNLGGNFLSYDVYKNQILPLLGSNSAPASPSNIEVINCVPGVRQANLTDCTKYYVCSKKDGKVLSYSCPPYTGFNAQTHICDAKTFAFCNPQAIYNRFTVSENRKIQMDAIQALEDAKKIRDQAIQAQNMANLIRLETQKVMNNTRIQQNLQLHNPTVLTYLPNLQQQSPLLQNGQKILRMTKPGIKTQLNSVRTKKKRQRLRCTDGAKIPDPESNLNYYVCFKNSEGKIKRRKMTCTAGLIFCSHTVHCTLARKCKS